MSPRFVVEAVGADDLDPVHVLGLYRAVRPLPDSPPATPSRMRQRSGSGWRARLTDREMCGAPGRRAWAALTKTTPAPSCSRRRASSHWSAGSPSPTATSATWCWPAAAASPSRSKPPWDWHPLIAGLEHTLDEATAERAAAELLAYRRQRIDYELARSRRGISAPRGYVARCLRGRLQSGPR